MAQQISWSKPNCQEKCGNVTIAYPFGIGPGCSANSSFAIICNSSTPFLSSINLEVVNISVHGVVIVNQPVSPMNCSDAMTVEFLPMSLGGSPFTISARYNSLAVLGCANSVWLLPNATTRVGVGGCMAICEDNSFTNSSCDGINCCTATIPQGLQSFVYRYISIQSTTDGLCGYTFPVDKKWFQQDYKRYTGLQSNQSYPYDQGFEFAPLVLEWELENHTLNHLGECKYASNYSSYSSMYSYEQLYTDPSASLFYSVIGYERCSGGICNTTTISWKRCGSTGTCINKSGGYSCRYPKDDNKSKIAFISVGSVLGALFLLFTAWMSARAIRKRIKAKCRQEFFKRNGGLLLQQQLSSTDSSLEKTKLFSYKELAQATDHYNENRILGRGGQGTVYKGMLTDGKIVAVKKSKKVEEGDLQDFINEVVILSQVNHRNVVRLLGCCLETEVPLLVYEFIPNGTLFELVHDPSEDFPLSWEMRLQIAREVAGALAYLHSAASVPIYHRDIKSTNILLDDKYRAKVSDFGASRSIAIDQTHLTTRVLGTFGYLDPEYFQSSQFTEKSDVYSFGVVMVELLTGEKAISSIRAEVGRSLATHFLHSMEENQLFDILDATVLEEGKREEIMSVAELARRCLHLNGKKRPTMKEVAIELEGIQMVKLKAEESINKQNQDSSSKECHAIEVDESYDFSSIAESMHFDANAITDYSQDDRRRLLDS
ncbi:hypothetical protein C2S51_016564 [Perilla frutescens var. frutescens]|nr:hypothetical protein C2S51_016564 [Perilla frutescens var. frutescens]